MTKRKIFVNCFTFSIILQPWQAGPEYADACMAIISQRFNHRASCKYRDNFPNFGHYEFYLIFQMQSITSAFSGVAAFERLGLPTLESYPNCTLVDNVGSGAVYDPNFHEEFTEADALAIKSRKDISDSMKYLAVRQKSTVPYTPVNQEVEKRLFKLVVNEFTKRNGVDFEAFAASWNSGTLPMPTLLSTTSPLDKEVKRYWAKPAGKCLS